MNTANMSYAIEKLVERLDIPYAGLSDLGILREQIAAAFLAGEREDETNLEVHICNEVMNTIEPRFDIGYSYEDRNLESCDAATEFFEWLGQVLPGHFVLITTGDYIIPNCGDNGTAYHADSRHDCETYDPHYWFYVMTRDEWDRQSEDIKKRDSEWREHMMQCSAPIA